MQSQSKNRLSQAQIQALVINAFGEKAQITDLRELTEGWYNAAYVFQIPTQHKSYVLKISPKPGVSALTYEQHTLAIELQTYSLLQKTKMPIPKIYHSSPMNPAIGSGYFCMDYVEGVSWAKLRKKLTFQENCSIESEIAEYQYQVNQIDNPTFGPLVEGFGKFQPQIRWADAFHGLMDDLLDDYTRFNVSLPRNINEIRRFLDRADIFLNDVKSPRLVLWDLWGGNVILNKKNGVYQIAGVVDFERSLWGDPMFELFFSFMEIDSHPALVQRYNLQKHTPSFQVRRALYDLYLYLIWRIEATYRGYPRHMNLAIKFGASMLTRKRLKILEEIF